MKRASPSVDLTQFCSGDYSDGETSDDLYGGVDSFQPSKLIRPALSVEQILQDVDLTLPERSKTTGLIPFSPDDFPLMPETERETKPPSDPVECVVTVIPHESCFSKVNSAYSNQRPMIVGWCDIKNLPSVDYQIYVNSLYKQSYQKLRSQIKCVHMVSPPPEKLDNLASIRKEVPISRTIFHLVGAGTKVTTGKFITAYDYRTGDAKQYSVKKIFENLGTPSAFVLDCDNAGSILHHFLDCQEELMDNNSKRSMKNQGFYGRTTSWDDWFAFCLCANGEELPAVSFLPRDFLTSCLLSPIQTSILCHILRYYRGAFPENEYLSLTTSLSIEEQSQLMTIFDNLAESIAADYLKPDVLARIFSTDKVIATMFRRFLLAQYLLKAYNVHPESNPRLPDMSGHRMWGQWKSILDSTIVSIRSGKSLFARDFFRSAIVSFENHRKDDIKESLLSILGHIPYDKIEAYPEAERGILLLTKFVTESAANKKRFVEVATPMNLFRRFVRSQDDSQMFKSLCYLLMILIDENPTILYEATKELDFSIIPTVVFDENLSITTRYMVCCILAAIVPVSRSVRLNCATQEYLNMMMQATREDNAIYVVWCLILLRKVLTHSMYELPEFETRSYAAQIAICFHHKSHEVRAAAVSVMACLLANDDSRDNLEILYYTLPLCIDASYFVRNLVLSLITKYISGHRSSFMSRAVSSELPTAWSSFREMTRSWYKTETMDIMYGDMKFKDFLEGIEKIMKNPDYQSSICQLIYIIVSYFVVDPHPMITPTATTIKTMIENKKHENSASIDSTPSDSISSGCTIPEDFEQQAARVDNDSDLLYDMCMKQLIESGMTKHTTEMEPPRKRASNAALQLRAQTSIGNKAITKLLFKPNSMNVVVSSDDSIIYHLNPDFSTNSYISVENPVTDIAMVGSYCVICDSAGCATLWDTRSKMPTTVWRADPVLNEKGRLICTSLAGPESSLRVLTSKGDRPVCMWDIDQQKLIAEWSLIDDNIMTHMASHPFDPNIVVFGYSDGRVASYDVRTDKPVQQFGFSLDAPIGRIAFDNSHVYVTSEVGAVISWDSQMSGVNRCGQKRGKLSDFDVHNSLGMMVFSPEEGVPFITGLDNSSVVQTFDYVDPGAKTMMHSTESIVAFGTKKGSLYCYQVNERIK